VASVNDILEGWRKDGIEWVRFELPDMHGTSRSKTIPLRHALGYAERGLNMYGGASVLDSRSDVVGGTLYNEERRYADQLLFPDPDTAAVVPWADRTARLICDARWYDGSPLDATPRQVYRRALERCRAMGYEPVTGFEYEFYLLYPETLEPLFSGYHIFNTVRNAYVPTIGRILEQMPQIGVDIITSNCEYAGSQWEINFGPGKGLAGPDNAFTFKNGVKEIARGDGYLATFMSKPFADSAGSGCHTHMSLVDSKIGENAFGDADDPQGITDVCRSFIAGQLRYATGGRRAHRSHGELPSTSPEAHLQPDQHLLGPRGPLGAPAGEGRGARVDAHRESRPHRPLESLPGRCGPALGRARGDRAEIDASPALERVAGRGGSVARAASLHAARGARGAGRRAGHEEFFGDEFLKVYTAIRGHELARFADSVSDWERQEYLELF
jgi:glutamine synthetase